MEPRFHNEMAKNIRLSQKEELTHEHSVDSSETCIENRTNFWIESLQKHRRYLSFMKQRDELDVSELLYEDIDINWIEPESGESFLWASLGKPFMDDLLEFERINPNVLTPNGAHLALEAYTTHGLEVAIKIINDTRFNPRKLDSSKKSILLSAVENNSDLVNLLLKDKRTNPNYGGINQPCPIEMALRLNNIQLVRKFLKFKKTDLSFISTELIDAISTNTNLLSEIFAHPTFVFRPMNLTSNIPEAILNCPRVPFDFIESNLFSIIQGKDARATNRLFSLYPDLADKSNSEELSALSIACECNFTEGVREILKRIKRLPSTPISSPNHPLYIAASREFWDIFKILIEVYLNFSNEDCSVLVDILATRSLSNGLIYFLGTIQPTSEFLIKENYRYNQTKILQQYNQNPNQTTNALRNSFNCRDELLFGFITLIGEDLVSVKPKESLQDPIEIKAQRYFAIAAKLPFFCQMKISRGRDAFITTNSADKGIRWALSLLASS